MEVLKKVYKNVYYVHELLPDDWKKHHGAVEEFCKFTESNIVTSDHCLGTVLRSDLEANHLKGFTCFEFMLAAHQERLRHSKRPIPVDEQVAYLNSKNFLIIAKLFGLDKLYWLLDTASFFEKDKRLIVQRAGQSISSCRFYRETGSQDCTSRAEMSFSEKFVSEEISLASQLFFGKPGVHLLNSRLPVEPNLTLGDSLAARNCFRKVADIERRMVDVIFTQSISALIGETVWRNCFEKVKLNHTLCQFNNLLNKHCPYTKEQTAVCSDLLRKISTHCNVCSYVRAVLYHVFPLELFGSASNREKFYRSLKQLITSGMNCKLRLTDVFSQVHLVDIGWLYCLNNEENRQHGFHCFCKWTVSYFVYVLRCSFYVTESQKTKAELVFVRHQLWASIKALALHELEREGNLEAVPEGSISENGRNLYQFRFLPKTKHVRPICKLSKQGVNCSKKLKHIIVLFIQQLHKQCKVQLDSFVDIVRKVVRTEQESGGRFYFIRADIQDCYPNIKHDKLVELVELRVKALFPNLVELVKQEFAIVRKGPHRPIAKTICKFFPSSNFPVIPSSVFDTNDELLNGVVLEPRHRSTSQIEDLVQCIREYILETIWTIDKKFYKLRKGVSQGGLLSNELSLFYVKNFVDEHFDWFKTSETDFVSIFADDMLFVTQHAACAKVVLVELMKDTNDFGITINRDKLRTNVQLATLARINHSEMVYFGSHGFNFTAMKLTLDYSSFEDRNIRYSFACNPFAALEKVCQGFVQTLSLILTPQVLDEAINSKLTVAENIFEAILVQSLRLACFKRLSPQWSTEANGKNLIDFSNKLSRRLWRLMQKWLRSNKLQSTINEADIEFICATAVSCAWSCKMSHRRQEVVCIKKLSNQLQQFVNREDLYDWLNSFRQYPKGSFETVIMPRKC
ncbi:Telomerase reverse transcriptase [Halotydeus destructor]|nr:Telomerase reverse transcriptase [Halotydeus destructor]